MSRPKNLIPARFIVLLCPSRRIGTVNFFFKVTSLRQIRSHYLTCDYSILNSLCSRFVVIKLTKIRTPGMNLIFKAVKQGWIINW